MSKLINDVKQLRLDASEVLVLTEKSVQGRYVDVAVLRLREGMMFLGKVLAALGEPSPYEGEPTEDIADFVDEEAVTKLTGLPINVAQELRDRLQELISTGIWNQLFDTFTGAKPFVGYAKKDWMYATQGLMCFTASKMWIGMAMNDFIVADNKPEDTKPETKEDVKDEKPETKQGAAGDSSPEGKDKEQSDGKPEDEPAGKKGSDELPEESESKEADKPKGESKKADKSKK